MKIDFTTLYLESAHMHPINRLNTALTVFSMLLCAACSGPEGDATLNTPTQTAPAIQEVVDPQSEKYLQQMVQEERFSGVALVMKAGTLIHAKGYGSATDEMDNTVDTAFHVASVTKQFTAVAILQLVESGTVNLDTSVNEYLPQQYRSPKWESVNIHHLLSHSSGIPDYALTRDYYEVVDGFCLGDTVDGMVKEAMTKDLEFEPGSEFAYSNIGFTLLGLVIENQTSTPFNEYLKANVLEPMGMASSRIHVIGHVPTANEAAGYRWNEEIGAHSPDKVVTLPVTAPDGGLVTTLSDFIKWADIYMGGRQEILTKQSLATMTTPVIPMPSTDSDFEDPRGVPQSYGYGLYIGESFISHTGYIVGFRSHFIVDREKQVLIAVFSNNTTNDPKRISTGLLETLDSSSH
jgi:CubicO group peptidase (beta-lactamase class C family)